VALIALAADKGSPGVTTTAIALGAVWPGRTIVAECDPAGGDLAYRLPGSSGAPLDPNRGLLSLAATARHGVQPQQVWDHVQVLNGGLEVLVGVTSAEQAGGLRSLWEGFGRAFRQVAEADVLVDCGRLGPDSPSLALLRHASLLLLVARATVESVAHTRDRLAALAGGQGASGVLGPVMGVVLVAGPDESRDTAAQVTAVLRGAQLPVEVVGTIAHDPKGAALLNGQWGGRLGRSLLVRSARQVAAQVHGLLVSPSGAVG
jgi:MinD-like ATPase involved in chromosome partitioning or flagellar assembly